MVYKEIQKWQALQPFCPLAVTLTTQIDQTPLFVFAKAKSRLAFNCR